MDCPRGATMLMDAMPCIRSASWKLEVVGSSPLATTIIHEMDPRIPAVLPAFNPSVPRRHTALGTAELQSEWYSSGQARHAV